MRTRMQSLGLLGRALNAAGDAELDAMVESLDADRRDALGQLSATDADSIREAVKGSGRLDGTMESVAAVLTEGCLADCVEQLGDHADHPTSDELRAVLPGLIERHGLAATRLMLASTVTGEANASAIIRDLLKSDDVVKLPPAEPPPAVVLHRSGDDEQASQAREALLQRRKRQRKHKQAEARARRDQAREARQAKTKR